MCASCNFTVPQNVAEKLPVGAPGSTKDGGKSTHGAPVLRSREFVCLGRQQDLNSLAQSVSSQESKVSPMNSLGSAATSAHDDDCHDHALTYLTTKSPHSADSYAQLRASVIRALSFEVLPKGLSEGPLCFGDSNSGYTIAYVFRLTDPKARGKRRAYAFVALAGHDSHRAFKACPTLWNAFSTMSAVIEQTAQKHQEEEERKLCKQRRESAEKETAGNSNSIASYLTYRWVDPDGHPRRAGQAQPRNLADIVGDENIFAVLHQYFVAVLRVLGDQLGGLPVNEAVDSYEGGGGKKMTTAEHSKKKEVSSTVDERTTHSLAIDDKTKRYHDENDDDDNEDTFKMSFSEQTSTLAPIPTRTDLSDDSIYTPLHDAKTLQRQVMV